MYRFHTCTAISCGDERGESSFAVTFADGADVDGVGVGLGAGAGDLAGVDGAAFGAGDGAAADFLAMAAMSVEMRWEPWAVTVTACTLDAAGGVVQR